MRLAKKILYILGVAVVFACMVGTGYWLSFLQTSTERWFRVAKVSSSSASEPYECEITSTGGVYLDAGNEKVTESRLTQGEKMTFKFRANGDEKSATMIASSAIGITEQTVRDASIGKTLKVFVNRAGGLGDGIETYVINKKTGFFTYAAQGDMVIFGKLSYGYGSCY